MKKRILHIRSGFLVGGPEKLILSSLLCSDNAEFDFMLSSFCVDGKNNEFLDKAASLGIITISIDISGSFDLSALSKIKNIIKSNKIDLIVTHDYRANFLALIARSKKKTPLVAVAHGWTSQDKKVSFYELIEKKLLRYSDKVIAVSKEKFQELNSLNIPPDKIVLIENGIIVPDIEKSEKNSIFKEELGLDKNCFLVGTVGRMSVEKGHIYFLEAALNLIEKYPDMKFVIVGDGALKKETMDFINKHGLNDSVLLPGWLSDVEKVYRGIDLFVLPSLTEGLPVALLEAMSYKLPIIASAVGGCASVLENEKTGILVESKNSVVLEEKITELYENRSIRDSLGNTAYAKVRQDYNIETYTKKFIDIYRQLLSGRGNN